MTSDDSRAESDFLSVWSELAYRTVELLTQRQATLTTDDVWMRIEHLPKPNDPRALGPVMLRAQRNGLLTRSGAFRVSQHKANHKRPVSVWLSVPAERHSLTEPAESLELRLL